MSRIRPLYWQYNSQLNTSISDFLPIIGNNIPNKLLTYFSNTDYSNGLVYFGSETAPAILGMQNQNKSYLADGCLDVNFNAASNQNRSVWIDFTKVAGYYNTTASQENFADLKSISRTTNNFATIYRAGSGNSDKDDLFFVLNVWNQILSGSAQMVLTFYNGTQTATLNSNYNPVFQKSNALYTWQKCQWALNSTNFTYAGGFVAASWSGITKIQIQFYAPLKTPTNGDIFLHGAWLAVPQANSYLSGATTSPTIANAYYPDLSANSVYTMAWNEGQGTYEALGTGIAGAVGAGKNLVVMDSQNYRPTSSDMKTIGILQGNTNIYAGYLETPSISSKKGVVNPNIVGAKTIGYTRYNDVWKFTIGAQRFTVGKTGAMYSTLQAAISAATSTTVYIDFIDSNIYTGTVTIPAGKTFFIQAVDGQSPVIQNSGGSSSVGITINGTVTFNNIVFSGASLDSEVFIGCAGAVVSFYNCSFKNVGANAFTAKAGVCVKALTSSQINFYNSLFSDMGWYVNVIDLSSATTSSTMFNNCIAYLSGQTASSIFLYANLYTAQTIMVIGSQIMQDSSIGYAYAIYNTYNGSILSGGPAPFLYIYFNETNCRMFFNAVNSAVGNDSIWISKNYIHDINGTLPATSIGSGLTFNAFDIEVNNGQAYCRGNIFFNITSANNNIAVQASYANNRGNLWLNYNIFYNCSIAAYVARKDAQSWDNNVAVNCWLGIGIYHYNNNATISGWIFSGCTYSVSDLAAVFGSFNQPWVYINNSIVYNSPLNSPLVYTTPTTTTGTQVLNLNCNTSNPGLTNPYGKDFSWNFQSEIEAANCTAWTTENNLLSNQSGLGFYFMSFQGETGETFYNTSYGPNAFNYSTFTGYGIAINDSSIQTGLNFCEFTGTGIGFRAYKTTGIGSTITSCIFDYNDTALLLRSGVTLSFVTATNNTYGVTVPAIGFLSVKGAVSGLFGISGSIFYKNAAIDYALNYVPTGCIVGTSLYNINQTTTFTATLLDPAYYFPAIKKLGYYENSPAFNKTNGNMGARNSNAYLTPALTTTQYNSAYVGTIDANDNFYCLENPQIYPTAQQAINPSGLTFVTSDYQSTPTSYASEYTLKWTTPGAEAKISLSFYNALLAIFQTGWFVAVSQDLGNTWAYYRVIKDSPISLEQQKFLYTPTDGGDDQIPFGNFTLKIRLIPNFNITDYTV